MFIDANAELEAITAERRHLPKVLAVRIEIYRGPKKWELMQAVAKKLNQWDPDLGLCNSPGRKHRNPRQAHTAGRAEEASQSGVGPLQSFVL